MWLGDDLFEALLIQKDVKPWTYLVGIALSLRFESFVNLEGCKTDNLCVRINSEFESFVNSKEYVQNKKDHKRSFLTAQCGP